jgi:hypothetical protein
MDAWECLEDIQLPWNITVHYQHFPAHELPDFKSYKDCFAHFKNAFKESCYLRFGSSQAANALSENELMLLWTSACTGELVRHRELCVQCESGLPRRRWALRVLLVCVDGRLLLRRRALDCAGSDKLSDVLLGVYDLKDVSMVRCAGMQLDVHETSVEDCVQALSGPERFLTLCVRA